MAQLDVEKKNNNDWWKWLIGILIAIIVIWVVVDIFNDDADDDTIEEVEPVAVIQHKTPLTTPVLKA